jgi:hypothetical protein
MIQQQHHILLLVSKKHQLSSRFGGKVPNFLPILDQKVAWLGTDGDSGTGLTLHHHSLDPYGGHGMIQQH